MVFAEAVMCPAECDRTWRQYYSRAVESTTAPRAQRKYSGQWLWVAWPLVAPRDGPHRMRHTHVYHRNRKSWNGSECTV